MSKNLLKKIQENILRYELFKRGGKIVVGVSGGPDSICLLDALHNLKKKYDLELIIAHANYGLRGKDSDLDEKLARKLAEKYGLSTAVKKDSQGLCFIGKVNLKEFLKHFVKEKPGKVLDESGKIIGKQGKTINAIRSIVKAAPGLRTMIDLPPVGFTAAF